MSIIGHQVQLAELQSNLDVGNIAHAYLFSGPRHVGKLTVAKWFAGRLLQEDAGRLLIHPDCLVLDRLWIENVQEDWEEVGKYSNMPQVHRSKQPKAKTDSIGIDDIRVIQQRLQETSMRGHYRCCIIRSVERMQDAAVNALLKMLEEPPAGCVLLLTTQKASSVLPTILSRVRVVEFRAVADKDLLPFLAEYSAAKQHVLLRLAQGAPGKILQWQEHPKEVERYVHLFTLARQVYSKTSAHERMQALALLEKKGEEAGEFLKLLFIALQDLRPAALVEWESTLRELAENLSLNVNRTLAIQHFVFSSPSAERARAKVD
ncbi:hypothetical protein COU77_01215 [Candidatus Peregrinibacteria bacterium CG10_big_fil_rev_8_21_14_0_10_49_16]|nr:MAG: hypothetical protein COW95_03825 [Candidatus Peregrinibacteria bacterium CG22_combo_CG10-13_8_21_14_all_49_11]PIR52283.1 MAG: hypothetical protein COU77_01215 [Candidatus Peregrinibacteria bacterium CG10_big_fil_rev_8_21_14_0_10_49_16]